MKPLDLRPIARLAKLHFTAEELKKFESQVPQILEFVERLNEVHGLEGVEPTSHPLPMANVFREDVVRPSLALPAFLKHAPRARGAFFEVPKVIEDKN
jgi:aspartyl-tRNA(Asn)/glutamyl-tRNA(Gln) amidotransferase subunit C